jgi:hypothetical protein
MRLHRVWALALGLLFLAAHLPFLAPDLEDIDSLNFALGLRDFDPSLHQPHPPGYPVFIALGKLARLMGLSESHALAIWGPLFGVIAIFALIQLFRAIEGVERRGPSGDEMARAALATTLTVACPLFWFTAVRPMSDVPGLAVALVAQALFATAFWRQREMPPGDREGLAQSGRLIVLGSLVAALALGFRSQTIWLTAPPLMLVILHRVGRGAAGAILGASIVFALGVTLWAVPMLLASGGLRAYLGALGSQAGEDLSGVGMLLRNPTPRGFAVAVVNTVVLPWSSTALAIVAGAFSLVGVGVMLARARIGLLLLFVLAGPYAVFHLLLQETVTTRYALPLVPALSYLGVRGMSLFGHRTVVGVTGALAVGGMWLTLPAVSTYANRVSPTVQAMREVKATIATARPGLAVIGMHQVFARAAAVEGFGGARVLGAPPMRESNELVRYWLDGQTAPIWFFADPARTDLELIDPHSRHVEARYTWAFPRLQFMSGVRPDVLDVVKLDSPPGWVCAEGWHLTPETLGISEQEPRRNAVAYVRRTGSAMNLLLAGIFLPGGGAPGAYLRLIVDDKVVDEWDASAATPSFLRTLSLPAGTFAGEGELARLVVAYGPADGSEHPVRVRLTHFELQPEGVMFYVPYEGWHEIEYNPLLQRRWRWASDHAETIVHHADKNLTLTIAGESPLRYFDRAPHILVRAGDRVLAREEPSSDFQFTVRVPSDALDAAGGRVTLETDEIFVPAERSENQDRRRLGLRIWNFELREDKGR